MTLMNDEAELAGVLGHEIGHVAAQHGKKRQSAATRNTILGVLGQVLIWSGRGRQRTGWHLLQKGIGTGAQLLTLKFSRTQEYEADDLGVQYLSKAGYDPAALSTMLASLAAQTVLDGQASGSRAASPNGRARTPIRAHGSRGPCSRRVRRPRATLRNKALFLGISKGCSTATIPTAGQSSSAASSCIRPSSSNSLRRRGYAVDNQSDSVTISSQSAKAQFGGGRYDGNLDAYVQSLFQQLAGQGSRIASIPLQRTTINGIAAAHGSANMTNSQGSRLTVTIVGYAYSPSQAYQLRGRNAAGSEHGRPRHHREFDGAHDGPGSGRRQIAGRFIWCGRGQETRRPVWRGRWPIPITSSSASSYSTA